MPEWLIVVIEEYLFIKETSSSAFMGIFCVLEIKWLAANDTCFSSSKVTCSISALSSWVLKSKGAPLMLDCLCFKVHKKMVT